ncbi:MAG: flagellar hook-length control protein FliK, partial [Bdellovibrionales bacterium]|nr:flagellar hook-length control protein FliK [Bdellovibrionales bacterium]
LPLEEFFRQSPIQNLETRGVSFQKSIEPQIQSALKDNEGTQILFSKDFQSSEAIYRKLFEVITGRQQHQPPLQEYAQKTESPTIPTPLSQEHSPTPTATLHTVLHQLQEALQKPNLELKDLSELVSVVENLYKELQSNPRMFDTRTREPISQQFLEEAFSGIRDKLKSLLEDDSRASSTTRTALIKQINLLLRHIHQSDQPESSSERTTIETYETLKHQFEKIDFKDTSRTSSQKTAELLENYFQGQEALRRLHPLMQQLKEPMLFIIPGFLQSFMKNLEVRFLPPETFENQSSGEKETYERFSLTFAFPSLGNIRADVAYRGTHLLLSIAAESEAAVECIDKNLDRLRLALSHLGFQSQQLITRKLQDHQHSIQPEWFRDLLGTRRIA